MQGNHDNVRLCFDRLPCNLRIAFGPTFKAISVHDQIFAFRVTELAQTPKKADQT